MSNLITYKIEAARRQQPLKHLSALSRALTQDAIAIDAQRNVQNAIVQKMDEEIAQIKSTGVFTEKANTITGFDMNTLAFDFDENAYIRESANKYIVTEFDINNLFNRSGKILGDGLHMAYWIKHSTKDHIEVKVEVIVLVNDTEAMKRLNEFAENEFDRLYEANKRAISQLKESRRSIYEKLLFSSDKPVAVPWQLPNIVDFSTSADAAVYEKHLFIENNGRFKQP